MVKIILTLWARKLPNVNFLLIFTQLDAKIKIFLSAFSELTSSLLLLERVSGKQCFNCTTPHAGGVAGWKTCGEFDSTSPTCSVPGRDCIKYPTYLHENFTTHTCDTTGVCTGKRKNKCSKVSNVMTCCCDGNL